VFVVGYNNPVNGSGVDVEGLLGRNPPEGAELLRADFRYKTAPLHDMQLGPATNAAQVPPSGGRGSGLDIFLCMLLGLAPLLYTPESWFLLWLGARSRAAARPGTPPGLGALLWPLFAIGVAAFWAITLEGAGRSAAILPAIIGVARLLGSPVERAERRVRVDFARKKAAEKAKDPHEKPKTA
jgi:hypothetical protein